MAKIAYFCSMYPSRSHTFIRREIQQLKNSGFDISVFSTRKCAKNQLLSESDQVEYKNTQSILPINPLSILWVNLKLFILNPKQFLHTFLIAYKHRLPGLRNQIWAILQFFEAMILADMLKKSEVTHLHVHFANSGANICYFTANYLKMSWSMTLHGTSCFDYPSGQLLGEKLGHCTFANCISNFGLSQAYRLSDPIHWSKLFISRCGIETNVVNEKLLEKKANSDDQVDIIFVGRLSPEKGVYIILQALQKAIEEVNNIKLTIVGDGPRRAFLEQTVKELNLQDYVEFTGAVAEEVVFDKMHESDMLVMASFMEGLPMVLMEAMALEVPVIAPRLAGIPELVIDGQSGLLYDPASVSQLSDRIVQLANNKGLRLKLGKQGREKVLSEYTITKATSRLSSMFKKVMQNNAIYQYIAFTLFFEISQSEISAYMPSLTDAVML